MAEMNQEHSEVTILDSDLQTQCFDPLHPDLHHILDKDIFMSYEEKVAL